MLEAADQQKIASWLAKNKDDLVFWGAFIVTTMVLSWFFSDWDFSLLLTLSSLTSLFAFVMVAVKVHTSRSVRGVSAKMFECYLIVAVFRLYAIVPFESYLPYDRTGDWLYQTIEFLSLLFVGFIVYCARAKYAATYDSENDVFPYILIIAGAFVLAFLFHPSLNSNWTVDLLWTFALYLESVTVLPQLMMFHRLGRVETFTVHFLAAQAVSRVLSFTFWVNSHHELNDANKPMKSYVGWWVLFAQLAQLVVMGDFIYYYARCIRKGISLEYVMQASDTV